MAEPAIRIANLGKQYRIGTRGPAYATLRDTIMDGAAKLRSRLSGRSDPAGRRDHPERFWALRDVSAEIRPGEVVGLIGRNGAGKTTLLKILSRITPPSIGQVELRGRVGSLLEVGTGFHGELTGRENIYLSGAILGMKKAEIDRKLDEIVAFADVETFLDTPLKHYSSGMQVRLAFAVAAHLETEILLVDEVLAVGDAEFRRRSMGKMGEVSRQGRTVVFVSHNMAMIEALCDRTLLLDDGRLAADGTTDQVVQRYLEPAERLRPGSADLGSLPRAGFDPHFLSGELNGAPLDADHLLKPRDPARFRLLLRARDTIKACAIGVHFQNAFGTTVLGANSRWVHGRIDLGSGEHEIVCAIPELPLVPGRYDVTVYLFGNSKILDRLERVATVEVGSLDVYGSGELPHADQGFFLTEASWDIAAAASAQADSRYVPER